MFQLTQSSLLDLLVSRAASVRSALAASHTDSTIVAELRLFLAICQLAQPGKTALVHSAGQSREQEMSRGAVTVLTMCSELIVSCIHRKREQTSGFGGSSGGVALGSGHVAGLLEAATSSGPKGQTLPVVEGDFRVSLHDESIEGLVGSIARTIGS